MIICIDIGNTNTSIGVFSGSQLIKHWRIYSDRERTSDELGILLKSFFNISNIPDEKIDAVVIASVVPPLTPLFVAVSKEYFNIEPLIVNHENIGIHVLYKNPSEVGTDRIVNTLSASILYGTPCIIVDFGTAITFDAVSKDSEYLGGCIFPGLEISLDALFHKTAKLPKVDVEKVNKVIGETTVESIKSGVYYGYSGVVKEIVSKMKEKLGEKTKVIGTGGYGTIFMGIECFDVFDPELTLKGLKIIYERSSQKEG
ncbi:MAG: type III pantothenate kinase [Candidatus Aminicenantia bacterium]